MDREIAFSNLYDYDYSIKVFNALKQYWKNNKCFSCIGNPKKMNILLYLDGCKAEYTNKDGTQLFAKSGDIIYTPVGCEYSVRFYDFETSKSNSIGVNFYLYDNNGNQFVLDNKILIVNTNAISYRVLFSNINACSCQAVQCHARLKSILYEILANLSELCKNQKLMSNKFNVILKGITYLEDDANQKMSIKEIAQMCNVSEIYFRRLFKEYAGVSPLDYKINTRINMAKTYLKYENLNITEIAYQIGYDDPSYFVRQFRAKVGMTPIEYKAAHTKL